MENSELIKTVINLIFHSALRERLLKQREDGDTSKSDFESLRKEMRAAALELDNRGHTNLPVDQMNHPQMSHTPLKDQGDLPPRVRGRDRPRHAPQQRGRRIVRGRGMPVPSWQT